MLRLHPSAVKDTPHDSKGVKGDTPLANKVEPALEFSAVLQAVDGLHKRGLIDCVPLKDSSGLRDAANIVLSAEGVRSLQRSLLVEGVGTFPNIDWNPTDVEFTDEVSGKVETFRVRGMQVIRPDKLKLPLS